MAVVWNKHRFSGGMLILDATNTVVLRGQPGRTFDRFADRNEIARFADAACQHRAGELGERRVVFDVSEKSARRVVELREAADRLFRSASERGALSVAALGEVLVAAASCLDGADEEIGAADQPSGDASKPLRFETALAVSALSLLSGEQWRKIRICPNCDWLFIDRSRNASRLWCDMSVCGNRHKARRHYVRRKAMEEAVGA